MADLGPYPSPYSLLLMSTQPVLQLPSPTCPEPHSTQAQSLTSGFTTSAWGYTRIQADRSWKPRCLFSALLGPIGGLRTARGYWIKGSGKPEACGVRETTSVVRRTGPTSATLQ